RPASHHRAEPASHTIFDHPSGRAYTDRAKDTAHEAAPAQRLASESRSPQDGNRLASGGPAVVQQGQFGGLLLRSYRYLHTLSSGIRSTFRAAAGASTSNISTL